MLAVVLTACVAPAPQAEPPPAPTEWSWEADNADPDPPLDAAAVTAGAEAARDLVWWIDPREVHDGFEATLLAADDACPHQEIHNGQPFVTGDCTTAAGAGYYGFAIGTRLTDLNMTDGLFHEVYDWFSGTYRYEGTDGTVFVASGDALYRDYAQADGDPSYAADLRGRFDHTGPGAEAGSWLGAGLVVDIELETVRWSEGHRTLDLALSVAGLDGAVDAARSDLLAFDTSRCALEPEGTLELHGPDGAWVALPFALDACDGCAEARLADGATAEICVDWSPLVGWEDRPW